MRDCWRLEFMNDEFTRYHNVGRSRAHIHVAVPGPRGSGKTLAAAEMINKVISYYTTFYLTCVVCVS